MTYSGPIAKPYVEAGTWRKFLAWLVDSAVCLLGALAGVVVLSLVDRSAHLTDGVLVLSMPAILIVVPLLYGLCCYRDGRALGAVLTGTRLVRVADGGRIGGKAPWAMLVRTVLLPLLLAAVIAGALAGGGTAPGGGGSQVRVAVDARGR
ncbi:RDD family protein [Amycolatopsis sp. YIM 10]|uniref:RDD family protein n=1 Tax=Amycolatopsis sp. YIM 10 TaxID=2653857 RepID=UPI0012901761|nr:RDD family protein [Amycolatopsis sp. YIM 10]QFU91929.1 RDD family protein [Amycolatopsis sp. YIM 10]